MSAQKVKAVRQGGPETKLSTVTVSFVVEARRRLTKRDTAALRKRFTADGGIGNKLIEDVWGVLDKDKLVFVHAEPDADGAPNTLTVEVR